ncbi:hypothetical protein CDL12_20736 [Handroanthus impetiginosus]|uniref:S-protein homolog n=1 Tax=Handroanthus impetiginosus TaxID=429701 RepID=A0A2G9GNB9_9LAMI|nr:hypothetical protein CDL12_20736 [Handroanthus impetiginosus]
MVRCQSKDDDLGYHNLAPNQDYNWSFCDNTWATTLFFCHLDVVFDAFKARWYEGQLHEVFWVAKSDGQRHEVFWVAKSDGIYFFELSLGDQYVVKKHDRNK